MLKPNTYIESACMIMEFIKLCLFFLKCVYLVFFSLLFSYLLIDAFISAYKSRHYLMSRICYE